jgi:asparagine synthase (glutamine-hydrolysing)
VLSGNVRWSDGRLQELSDDRSPADALIAAYERLADRLTDCLFGSFSFAVIDEDAQCALLAIDRFGVEQMYWSAGGAGDIRFSTSGRAILQYLPRPAELDQQSIYDFLYFHTVPSPGTIWNGVNKLKPGEQLTVKRKTVSARTYWSPSFERPRRSEFAGLKRSTFAALRGAVGRAAANSNPGAFLSGGLDSSTVCGLLQELSEMPVEAFSIGFSIGDYNELDYARIAARHFELQHHCILATADETVDCLEKVLSVYDEPFGNSSAVPTYLCALAARNEGKRVLLAGDGGDELFGGNFRYAKQKLFEQYLRLPGMLRRHVIEPALFAGLSGVNLGAIRKLHRYVEQAIVPLPARLESYNHLEYWDGADIFMPEFLSNVDTTKPAARLHERFAEAPNGDYLDRMLYLDWKVTLADNDLRKVMTMCDLAGVDVEFPFLDEEVVGASLRIPSEMKIRRLELRHFYKRAMQGFLPDEIIEKPKHGFGLPFGEWLRTSQRLQDLTYSALGDLAQRNIVQPHFIDELIARHRDDHAGYYGNAVWVLMALEIWFKGNSQATSAAKEPDRAMLY